MPDREMTQVKVYVSDSGYVCLAQDNFGRDDPETISLHPSQVDVVMAWLKEAQQEAVQQRAEAGPR